MTNPARQARRAGTVLLALAALVSPPVAGQLPAGVTGTVIVLNKRAATASFVDVESASIVATEPTGRGPHELVVSADGTVAVGTDYGGGGTLSVFDVRAARRVRTVDLGRYSRPHGIAFLPGDSVVAVTSESTGHVVLVHVGRGEIVDALSTGAEGSHMLAVTGDGATVWTGDMGSHTVTELRIGGGRVRSFPAPQTPEAVQVSPDGARVFAGSNGTGRVTAWSTRDGSSATVAEGFGWPYRIFLVSELDRILIPDLGNEVLRFFEDPSYRELGRLAFPGEGPQGLTLHRDGRHLFLSLSRANRIAVIDVPERRVVGYLPAGDGPDGIGYSHLTVTR